MKSEKRIIGLDLARAYAIFGMFIVNFNYAFGALADTSYWGQFLSLFVGNSTSIFIILAGMGASLMSASSGNTADDRLVMRKIVLRRSWFLFISGILLFIWWPGDILHFYGAYMHIAAFMLFSPKRYYLGAIVLIIGIYHLLLLCIPVETGWDFYRFQPTDFWTPAGFVRNTLYNGWNAVFPWVAYFLLGMWLGKLDWSVSRTRISVFLSGFVLFIAMVLLRWFARQELFGEELTRYIMSEYFPPYLPFMLITTGFALMVIPVFVILGKRYENSCVAGVVVAAGRMSLSLYVLHVTAGMLIFAAFSGLTYTGAVQQHEVAGPEAIFLFATCFFAVSVVFSYLWIWKFGIGPLEGLMRKFSGTR